MQPLEFRRINYLKTGQDLPNRQVMHDAVLLPESAERAIQALGESRIGSDSKKIGRGISSNLIGWGFPDNPSSCKIEMQSNGNAVVSIGVPDLGGGQSSAIAQIVADILSLPLNSISLRISDTATTPLAGPTAGSKTLYYTGNATYLAATAIRKRLLEVASDLIEANPEDLDLENGKVFVKGHADRGIAITQVIAEENRLNNQQEEL
jgi:CO/xanthine dehydrogenase Mo-binding subunit